jgi:hypothetical protein
VRIQASNVNSALSLRLYEITGMRSPTRSRPQYWLHPWDKLLWILARRICAGWRQHLSFVTPDTVVGWHRQGARSGVGSPAPEVDVRISAPRYGT